VGVAPVDLGAKTMKPPRKIVFHSVRQLDVEQKFLQKQSQQAAEYAKYLPIMIVLIILFDLVLSPCYWVCGRVQR
jgi:hypothetical protein